MEVGLVLGAAIVEGTEVECAVAVGIGIGKVDSLDSVLNDRLKAP